MPNTRLGSKFIATLACGLLAGTALRPVSAHAGQPLCAALDALYPQPGRAGLPGPNSFRPLPMMLPQRAGVGQPGTLSLSLIMYHVGGTTIQTPPNVYIGNYLVTDFPAMRVTAGAGTTAVVVDPVSGATLPIPAACLTSPEWAFGGTHWPMVQGDTMDMLFQSRFDYKGRNAIELPVNGAAPCRATNLHLHGLLVSPYSPAKPGQGPMGDYVLDLTQPHGSVDYHSETDDCDNNLGFMVSHKHGVTDLPLHYVIPIPGQPGVNSMVTGEHPSGIFFYHTHPHGYTRPQVGGGATGIVTVGALTDYACPDGDGTPGHCTLTNTVVRAMQIKDNEIVPLSGGRWSVQHFADGSLFDYNSGYCNAIGSDRRGECPANDGSNGKWVFTINSVQYPVMHAAAAGANEIWRILNASPDMTYHLHLVGAGPDGKEIDLPFQLLSKDGVSIKQTDKNAQMQQEVLMMPASRLEIYIPAPPAGGRFVLRNEPVTTGANGAGDIWPAVDLAEIAWPAGSNDAAPPKAIQVAGVTVRPFEPTAVPGTGIPANCQFGIGDTRVIYFVHRDSNSLGNEVFGVIAGVRHADGGMDFFDDSKPNHVLHDVREVWRQGINGPDPAFPGFLHNHYLSVCTVMGNVEKWEIQNWTAEDHNFHIHQTRFTLDPKGAFQSPIVEPNEPPSLITTDRLMQAFANRTALSYNDTIPLPRGQSFCAEDPNLPGCKPQGQDDNLECTGEPEAVRCARPGITTALLDFTRAEQVGTFVFHCHILDHEDGGMMGVVTVMCPPGNAICASQQIAHAPICTTPSTE